ncbi:Lrp/AsnC family transcriptional regulator [Pseudoruegeria sp. SK021]|uniref:Lrp/AsnC family transcriptional regulator n=1 Tax=Pseudoruegeria sp. SK021 TaxID=1933035 RepID=UPI000A22116D|nr:Lrp/AsnC family transcriptional regulator [Pseudoruegeria sp. SK021]OSP56865.1 AsnC family transcriptional regulator [Pseudoruegeria sp. SK021]
MQLDDQDRRLLRFYQEDPSLSAAALAERTDMTRATCWRRLEKLTAAGIIQGRRAVIDWVRLGYEVEVSLRITLDKTQAGAFDTVIAQARDIPEVIEIQTFLGRIDLRLSVIARDMRHYQDIYRSRILTLPHIADLEPLMRVATIKQTESLPL